MSEKKTVTERDLRHPALKHVSSIDDLEFNDFGEVVRKDRFEVALGNLSSSLYSSSHCIWSVSTVTEDLCAFINYIKSFSLSGQEMHKVLSFEGKSWGLLFECFPELESVGSEPKTVKVEVLLDDGTFLRGALLSYVSSPKKTMTVFWKNVDVTHSVLAMRHEKSDKPLLLAVHYNDELLTHSTYNQQEYAALKSKEYAGSPVGCPDKPSYLEQIVAGKL